MKVRFTCPICVHNGSIEGWEEVRPVGDSSIYKVTCPHGHELEVANGGFKFEMLFEVGIKALKNGFHREAASSFATALERFYEHSIGLFLMNKFSPRTTGTFDEEAVRVFEKMWRNALKLSERQLGAFYVLYYNEFNEAPTIFDEAFSKSLRHSVVKNPVNFRNRIVHEGYVPSYDEAFQYGEAVFEYMKKYLEIYKKKDVETGAVKGIDRAFFMTFFSRAITFIRRGEEIRKVRWGMGEGNFISANTSSAPRTISLADYMAQKDFL